MNSNTIHPGDRFGRLQAIEVCGKNSSRCLVWKCNCECGNQSAIPSPRLRSGKTRSCGCLQKEVVQRLGLFGKKRSEPLFTSEDGTVTRICSKCDHEKPIEDFYVRRKKHATSLKSLTRSDCKQCEKERNRKRKKCGIPYSDYQSLLEFQKGVCAICGKPETAKRGITVKQLSVDHDHVTGRIRGLLCIACNLMLGYSFDCPDVLMSAAKYLQSHKGDTT